MAVDAMVWIVFSIMILLAVVFVWKWKRGEKKLKPWTHENWFEAGALFLVLHYIMSLFDKDIFVLGSLGTLYVIIGFFGKYYIKDKEMNEAQRKKVTIIMSILVIAGLVAFFLVGYLAK